MLNIESKQQQIDLMINNLNYPEYCIFQVLGAVIPTLLPQGNTCVPAVKNQLVAVVPMSTVLAAA